MRDTPNFGCCHVSDALSDIQACLDYLAGCDTFTICKDCKTFPFITSVDESEAMCPACLVINYLLHKTDQVRQTRLFLLPEEQRMLGICDEISSLQ
jgi:hypothetical protein